MSAAESLSSSIPPAERDPRDTVFEAIQSGQIADLFARDTRDDVEGTIDGADSDYISLTPLPPKSVARDAAAQREMESWQRRRGRYGESATY